VDTYERVHEYLRKLGLNTMDQSLDNYIENSKDRSTMEILDQLLEQEVLNLKSRRFEAAFRYS
jgi:hypothetical protein